MSADPRAAQFRLLLEFHRELLRLGRAALQQGRAPEAARAWAAMVEDAERRMRELERSCRDVATPPQAPPLPGTQPVHALAAGLFAELQLAAGDAPPARLAASATTATPGAESATEHWELRVG
jgi:hypothetical protein